MFCPECGIEERTANQFCRACGVDLRRVRVAVESPDSITASAVSARDEIGRAVARLSTCIMRLKCSSIQNTSTLATPATPAQP